MSKLYEAVVFEGESSRPTAHPLFAKGQPCKSFYDRRRAEQKAAAYAKTGDAARDCLLAEPAAGQAEPCGQPAERDDGR